MILEVHFEPNYRAVVVCATISSEEVHLINVYLKSGGEPVSAKVSKMGVLIAVDAKGQDMSQPRFAWKPPP